MMIPKSVPHLRKQTNEFSFADSPSLSRPITLEAIKVGLILHRRF
jgi:hypothetical protein